ncbi:hypothetical protein B0H34DRAFT_803036 [Crassisporium funariophilum]|nr:hypothetical protein B0H34DRAFT_803036 [Crassisporium funariophilum]
MSAMFSSPSNTLITGGTFFNVSGGVKRGFDIPYQHVIRHPSGRFASGKMSECFIMWMYGRAGIGKSTIAQTITEISNSQHLLVGTFFFLRAVNDRNNITHLVSTIAYQLALNIPETRPHIEQAIKHNPSLFHQVLDTQIQYLIVGPLQKALSESAAKDSCFWPQLLIIDGLDEYLNSESQTYALNVLHKLVTQYTLPLKVLVVSWPEPHLRMDFDADQFIQSARRITLDDLVQPQSDVEIYLTSKLCDIKHHNHFSSSIPHLWPSRSIVQLLSRKLAEQFIYASTVINFLSAARQCPAKLLTIVCGLSASNDGPFGELNALYLLILRLVKEVHTVMHLLSVEVIRPLGPGQPTFEPAVKCSDPRHAIDFLTKPHCNSRSYNIYEQLVSLDIDKL